MRRSLLVVALLAVSIVPASAQSIDGITAGVRSSSVAATQRSPVLVPAPQDSATSRRVAPYILIGALVGGVVGFLVEEDYSDDFCTPAPGVTCSSDYEGAGVLIGAGLGALAGWIVYALTGPPVTTPP